jgi:coenzyme PQQ precursor peptide PqqA
VRPLQQRIVPIILEPGASNAVSTSYEALSGLSEKGRNIMKWSKPVIREYCVGMEVTSYDSAEIDPLF